MRSLIEDIRDVRFHKVETSLESIDTRTSAVKVDILFVSLYNNQIVDATMLYCILF